MLTVRVRRKFLSLVAGRTDGGPNGLNLFFIYFMLFRRFRGVMEQQQKKQPWFCVVLPFLSLAFRFLNPLRTWAKAESSPSGRE